MKKIYLLVATFLSLFSFNLFANGVKINNPSHNIKGGSATHSITQRYASKIKSTLALASTTASTISICEGDNLTLIANPSGGVAPYTFSWTGPNGFVSTDENPVINAVSLSDAGDYIVNITDSALSTFQNTTTVVVNAKIDPTFDATLPAICKGGTPPLLSTTSTNGITGSWSPSVVNNNTTTTYIFTPDAGQCANPLSFTIFVVNNVTPVFTLPASICQGDTPPTLSNISNNGIVGTWDPAVVSNTSPGTYIFSPSGGQCATTKTINISINPLEAVFLPAVAPICSGDFLAPLPTTSSNGVTGVWTPALNNTATTTYTFTPTIGQCTTATSSMTIVVNPNITPTFDTIAPICSGGPIPVLPLTSNNGYTGTWNPATVSNTASATYTFTPTAGTCTTTATLDVTISPNITPTFDAIAPICSGGSIPVLPLTSNNGYTGTWNPATVSNTASATYTFTPTAGPCTTTATLDVTISPNITPTFDAIPDVCYGSAAPTLPTTSNNGYAGTWNPATVSNTISGIYTFTPNIGQCTTATTLNVNITTITPTFDPIPDVCYGSTAPSLLGVSINGITGSWNPATVSNTASATYTFTPDAGQCAPTVTLDIVVTTIIPVFDAIAPICQNAIAPTLASSSTNGITGTWNPTSISNVASATYTFTPDAGQCATTATLNVTVNPNITPTFTAIPAICLGATSPVLPLTSNNGFVGTWNPATVSNTASDTYTFTPTAGQCATTTTLNITVIPNITPTFTAIAPICSGSTRPVLPLTSNNSIPGTWNPAIVSNTASATYTFTPAVGLCSPTTTLAVTVYQSPTDIVVTTSDVVNDGPDGIIEITGTTNGSSPYQYSINNGSFTSNTSYPNLAPGDYTITVRDANGCEFNKVVTITSICIFPNAISPGSDNYNDSFNLNGCNVVKLELFNRYGRKINSYHNYTDQWDGTNSNGEALPDGTYFYVAEFGDGTSKSGWVFVAR